MKTFTIYPDKARALGNVMNNNSNVWDMIAVNSIVKPLIDEDNPTTDEGGNDLCPPITVAYDNLPFPLFEMCVNSELYATSMVLNLSKSSCYVGEDILISAEVLDREGNPITADIYFKNGDKYIAPGYTGNAAVYASTNGGTYSFNYHFDSRGEYVIAAGSVATNLYNHAESTSQLTVIKRPVSININRVYDDGSISDGSIGESDSSIGSSTEYNDEIKFKVWVHSDNQSLAGLPYSILLDDESFDTGTSTTDGEIYTISSLASGTHNLEVYFAGNTVYDSCTKTVDVLNGNKLDIYISYTTTGLINAGQHLYNGDLEVDVYYETNPVANIPLTVQCGSITVTGETNSSGSFILQGFPLNEGNCTVTVTTTATSEFREHTTSKNITVP